MTCREIFELFNNGIFPVLECTENIEKICEVDPDKGMRGILRNINIVDEGEDCEHLCFIIDFGKFEAFNKPLGKANYYNSNHIPCETWFQQHWYERTKHNVEIFTEYDSELFNVLDDLDVYQEYLDSNSNIPYISWLESKYKQFKLGVEKGCLNK